MQKRTHAHPKQNLVRAGLEDVTTHNRRRRRARRRGRRAQRHPPQRARPDATWRVRAAHARPARPSRAGARGQRPAAGGRRAAGAAGGRPAAVHVEAGAGAGVVSGTWPARNDARQRSLRTSRSATSTLINPDAVPWKQQGDSGRG